MRDTEQEKALNSLLKSFDEKEITRDLLKATVRFGKSKVLIDFLNIKDFKDILIVIPKLANINQWKIELEKFAVKEFNIEFITYRSLHKLDWLPDLLILDEVQNITIKGYNKELFDDIKHIIALTGTLPSNKIKKNILKEIGFETVYSIEPDEAIDLEIINNFKIKVIYTFLNYEKDIEINSKSFNFKTSEYLTYKYHCKQIAISSNRLNLIKRANFIYSLNSKIEPVKKLLEHISKGDKTIIFCKRTETADALSNFTIHSKNTKEVNEENLEKFRTGEVLNLATVEQIKEGITISDIDNVILQQLDSNPANLIQKIGRALLFKKDKIVKVFIFIVKNTIEEMWLDKALPQNIGVEYFNYDKFFKTFKKI